jgi:hypothetical protein
MTDMIYEFEPLTRDEQEQMLKAPSLIAVLIAGADDKIDNHELKRAVELVKVKTFSEKPGLREYYKEVSNTIEQDIDDVLAALPGDAAGRNEVLSAELFLLNKSLSRLKPKFAHDVYASWKHYAHMIAQSWGGILGINSISLHEKAVKDLPMINEPALPSSEE